MATGTITVDNKYLTTTLHTLVKDAADQLHRKLSYFDACKSKFGEGKPTWDGGAVILEPWLIDEHSDPTAISTGYETINLNVRDVDVAAQFTWFTAIMPVVIAGQEERINRGPGAVASILERRKDAVMGGFHRKFVRQTFIGDVAQFSDLNTWNGVDYSTGFLEEDAVGSQTNSIGGLSKSTYASLPGAQNQRYDAAGSFNSNGIAAMIHINQKIRARHPMNMGPDAWFMSEAFSQNMKRSLQSYERYVGGADGVDAGKLYAVWDGVPCYTETYMANAGTNTTADPISAYAASMDYMKTLWHPEGYFNVGDFESCKPQQDVRAAHILTMAQNTLCHAGSQGLIFDAETF